MKNFIVLSAMLMSAATFAKLPPNSYEICKGYSSNGVPMTVVGNFTDASGPSDNRVTVNANGKRTAINLTYNNSCGDVEECYHSESNDFKITFYDEGDSASGWSQELGRSNSNVAPISNSRF